ncbi:unnamed protein product [Lota lota]
MHPKPARVLANYEPTTGWVRRGSLVPGSSGLKRPGQSSERAGAVAYGRWRWVPRDASSPVPSVLGSVARGSLPTNAVLAFLRIHANPGAAAK